MRIKKLELAYLAGFFDGEGCISTKVHKGIRINSRGEEYLYVSSPTVLVGVGQKDPFILYKFQMLFNGTVRKVKTNKGYDSHLWILTSINAENLLTKLLPYLISKRPQAEFALELLALQGKRGSGYQSNTKEKNKRTKLAKRIKHLKVVNLNDVKGR